MKFRVLLIAFTVVTACVSFATVTLAEQVPWISIEYTSSALAEIIDLREDFKESLGPPLPASSSAYAENGDFGTYASSYVDNSNINIDTSAYSCG